MKLTAEQVAIVETAASGASFRVQAYAGSAKTTSLVAAAKELSRQFPRSKKLIVAFNVKIKEEVEERMRGFADWDIRTMNSLGQGTLCANPTIWNNGKLNIDFKKTQKIVDNMLGMSGVRNWMQKHAIPFDVGEVMIDLIDKSKMFGIRPEAVTPEVIATLGDIESGNGTDSVTGSALASSGSEALLNGLARMTRSGINQSIDAAKNNGTIDFNDQVYLSMLYSPHHGRSWDIVLVDEAQDLSYLNHLQVTRACKTQLGALGDRFQALYGFRGATEESMADLDTMWVKKGNKPMSQLQLSLTFRCPEAIVARQSETVGIRDFRAHPASGLGSVVMPYVCRAKTASWGFGGIVDRLENLPRRTGTSDRRAVVLSATNAPLYLAAALLWQDLRLQTVDQFKDWCRFAGEPPAPHVLNVATGSSVFSHPQYQKNAAMCSLHYLHLVTGLQAKALGELFREDPNIEGQPITLSTVHRAKGLEWDDVYLFEGMDSTGNLRYVAETRAQTHLATIESEDHFRALKPGDALQRYIAARRSDFKPLTDLEKRLESVASQQVHKQPDFVRGWLYTPGVTVDQAKQDVRELLLAIKLQLKGAEAYRFNPTSFIEQWTAPSA